MLASTVRSTVAFFALLRQLVLPLVFHYSSILATLLLLAT